MEPEVLLQKLAYSYKDYKDWKWILKAKMVSVFWKQIYCIILEIIDNKTWN